MKIAMVGTGYVGLVTGACFAEFGYHVTCIDNDAYKISQLEQGNIPIYEPGLDSLVNQTRKAKRLIFTTDMATGIDGADAIFLAVGTPTSPVDGQADLSFIYQAAKDIAKEIKKSTVIITKSTVPVGTCREIERIIRKENPAADIEVASNPEFLREGSAISDFMRPDRVVIGTDEERTGSVRARNLLKKLYRPLYLIETPIVFTSIETAELIKYAANAFLATKIAFINEMADICEKVGANVQDIARGIGLDGRIGRKFLHAGPGYGGSCFPKDALALSQTAKNLGTPSRIVESVVSSNSDRKLRMAERIIKALGDNPKGKKVAILGVTFKPNTDDMRDAPSLTIIPKLQENGIVVSAYDPVGMPEAKKILPNVLWAIDSYTALDNADAVVILTEWNEFRALDLDRIALKMNSPLLIDLRNIYKLDEMVAAGFIYISIGRPLYEHNHRPIAESEAMVGINT